MNLWVLFSALLLYAAGAGSTSVPCTPEFSRGDSIPSKFYCCNNTSKDWFFRSDCNIHVRLASGSSPQPSHAPCSAH